jgi:hypothetical protein
VIISQTNVPLTSEISNARPAPAFAVETLSKSSQNNLKLKLAYIALLFLM